MDRRCIVYDLRKVTKLYLIEQHVYQQFVINKYKCELRYIDENITQNNKEIMSRDLKDQHGNTLRCYYQVYIVVDNKDIQRCWSDHVMLVFNKNSYKRSIRSFLENMYCTEYTRFFDNVLLHEEKTNQTWNIQLDKQKGRKRNKK